MKTIYQLLLVVYAIALSSCVKELDLESLRPDPTLVVNCVAQTGEPLRANISRTWFFTDDLLNISLEDAVVRLFVNGSLREQARYVEGDNVFNAPGYFQMSYIPQAGDKIRLEVTHPQYGEARAETVMPQQAQVVKAEVIPRRESENGLMSYSIQVTLRDDGSKANYYLMRLEKSIPIYDVQESQYTGYYTEPLYAIDYSKEPLFGQTFAALDLIFGNDYLDDRYGVVFDDDLINGREYTFKLPGDSWDFPYHDIHFVNDTSVYHDPEDVLEPIPPTRLRVLMYEVSEDYYRYLKVLQDQEANTFANTLIDGGLAEPIRVYSNIEQGVGILGSCHPYVFEQVLGDLHPEVDKSATEDREN